MFNDLKVLSDKMTEMRKEMQTEGKKALKLALKEFFSAFPMVEAIRWNQYTPYFNDGDACVFGVYEASIKLTDVDTDKVDLDEDGFIDSYDIEDRLNETDLDAQTKKHLLKAINSFNEMISDLPDVMLKLLVTMLL